MPKTGSFLHDSFVVTDVAAVGNAFDVTKFHEHDLYADTSGKGRIFADRVESVIVRVKTLAGSPAPTKIIIRCCFDATGDYTWLPDTEALISTGLTTTTSGCTAFEYKLPIKNVINNDSTVYLFFKTDNGTCTVDASCITWSE